MPPKDKVLQGLPLAKMIVRAEPYVFNTQAGNGFFIIPPLILEFDTLPDATKYKNLLNTAITPVINQFITEYQQKIQDILDA